MTSVYVISLAYLSAKIASANFLEIYLMLSSKNWDLMELGIYWTDSNWAEPKKIYLLAGRNEAILYALEWRDIINLTNTQKNRL